MAKTLKAQVKIKWVDAKASLYAYALSSRPTGMVWRSHPIPQQICLRNANRISAGNEIRKLNFEHFVSTKWINL